MVETTASILNITVGMGFTAGIVTGLFIALVIIAVYVIKESKD